MGFTFLQCFGRPLVLALLVASFSAETKSEANGAQTSSRTADTSVGALSDTVRERARILESSSGMKLAFQSFIAAHRLEPDSVRYSDFVVIRLLFEATRDAGLWNTHWSITDQPPNSDRIWQQWKSVQRISTLEPTATAECDELSALYAFLVERTGVKSVGLLWPYPNHTVAVWTVKPASSPPLRVVAPTTQIFLDKNDFFDTPKFNPWRQKNIYEYKRRDVPDSFVLPKPVFEFFVRQMQMYGGASDTTLQQLRYLRDGVFSRQLTPEQAANEAMKLKRALKPETVEDVLALDTFAREMQTDVFRQYQNRRQEISPVPTPKDKIRRVWQKSERLSCAKLNRAVVKWGDCRSVELRALCNEVPRTPPGPEGSNGTG
jgi:hypothetical protein